MCRTDWYAKLRGHFGAELKYAGFDMIIVEGSAEGPVILSILDDKISIQPAPEYWGRSTSETEALFKSSLADKWAGRETYLLTYASVQIGSIVRENLNSRRMTVELAESASATPREILLFMVWVVILIHGRE